MYRKENSHQLQFEDFYLPFGGRLRRDNRWVILAQQIPWPDIEKAYGCPVDMIAHGTPHRVLREHD